MRYSIVLLFILNSFLSFGQTEPDFLVNYDKEWVDNTFASLTLEQKIGQLLLPRANTSGKAYDPQKLKDWVRDYNIGGLVFFAGQPTVQSAIINELQELSKTPLLIGMDLEWGLAMRLDSTDRFPYQLSLGAMQGNTHLIEQMGEEIGKQCNSLGVHINFAPVVDININPNNPVINFRSFGEEKEPVANKALAYMKGLQKRNIIASAKHFPGHGDTGVDSHYDLPLIPHSIKRLDEIELYPYKELIRNGLSGIMTAHLNIPALDNTPNLASTLSPKIVTQLLKNDLGFKGLTFTDAMDMQGVVKYYPEGEALVMAFLAGNDILETFEDVPSAVAALKKAVVSGRIPLVELNARVKKILKAKAWVGLNKYKPIDLDNLTSKLNTANAAYLNSEFAEKSISLLKNDNDLLPIKDLEQKIAVVTVGSATKTEFQKMAANYTEVDFYTIENDFAKLELPALKRKLVNYDVVLIEFLEASIRPYANYGINDKNLEVLKELLPLKNTVLSILGNPYSVAKIPNVNEATAIVMGNQYTKYTQMAIPQAIFGAIPFLGKLPVGVTEDYPLGTGIKTEALGRLKYGVAEQVGVNSIELEKQVDSVVQFGIDQKAFPGAVLEIAKGGRVIYQKAYGYHTYEAAEKAIGKQQEVQQVEIKTVDAMDAPKDQQARRKVIPRPGIVLDKSVQLTDLYDFASVTKISTSALAVMQLMSEDKFNLNAKFADYYPEFKGTNKANLTFKDMLTHRSGLRAWIPFWMNEIDTLATIKQGLRNNAKLKNDFLYTKPLNKMGRKKLFAKKQVNYLKSVEDNPTLWNQLATTENRVWKKGVFSESKSAQFPVKLTDKMFLNSNYKNTLKAAVANSAVSPNNKYVYSDLHYYFYPDIIKNITGKGFEDYLKETYKSLGATTLTYNPLRFNSLEEIVPTELDTLFRATLLHGVVHDEGAALMGGVSGHAGLFGSANDLTKLMQMYLQKGSYGGKVYIKPEVVEQCTAYQYEPTVNRRAIAFDKLHPNKDIANGPQMASESSYGHSGYTGTFTWIDPKYDLVYVFLSNRVYPTRDNNKISELNIRTEIGNQIIRVLNNQEQ